MKLRKVSDEKMDCSVFTSMVSRTAIGEPVEGAEIPWSILPAWPITHSGVSSGSGRNGGILKSSRRLIGFATTDAETWGTGLKRLPGGPGDKRISCHARARKGTHLFQ